MDPTSIAVVLIGILWPYILQLVKKYAAPDLQDQAAHIAAVGLCYLFAVGIEAVAIGGTPGATLSLTAVLAHGSEIAAIALTVFRLAPMPTVDKPPASP